MPRKTLTLINQRGLHARAATRLVTCCQPFESRIHVYKGEQKADARNIMALLILAAPCGTELTVHAEGEDAEPALDAVEALFAARFDEDY
ncbi:MAG: HPr family phosphocarrier protein [Halomonas sp.]|nr:HPr family phosphocarrier protein [Halomonas sp.]MDN6297131.1 HPr family phosphocarrier protein [Halomonas sp.]MDN6313935.1 HPr family phosphocarrier protein [Halomonas sp.]MDN6335522.1 HPr family phosphocarrier protein [Halomonas sp.]